MAEHVIEIMDNELSNTKAGPYVYDPRSGRTVYLHAGGDADSMPPEVRLAIGVLLAALRTAGPVVQAHFGNSSSSIKLVPR